MPLGALEKGRVKFDNIIYYFRFLKKKKKKLGGGNILEGIFLLEAISLGRVPLPKIVITFPGPMKSYPVKENRSA